MFAVRDNVEVFKANVNAELAAFKQAIASKDRELALKKLLNIVSQATVAGVHCSVDKTPESEKLLSSMQTWIQTKGIPQFLRI